MATQVDIEDVRHMAQLSRLDLTEDEEKLFCRQFTQILAHMAVLEKVDTKNVDPLYSPVTHTEYTRKDEAVNKRTRKEILANAPQTDGEFFIVPRIV